MTDPVRYYLADPVRPKTLACELLLAALLLYRGWNAERVVGDLCDLPIVYRPPSRA